MWKVDDRGGESLHDPRTRGAGAEGQLDGSDPLRAGRTGNYPTTAALCPIPASNHRLARGAPKLTKSNTCTFRLPKRSTYSVMQVDPVAAGCCQFVLPLVDQAPKRPGPGGGGPPLGGNLLRGQATRKQAAEVVGVRPVRLKELEEGLKHPEGLETLGKVLRVYRVRLGVAMPTR